MNTFESTVNLANYVNIIVAEVSYEQLWKVNAEMIFDSSSKFEIKY